MDDTTADKTRRAAARAGDNLKDLQKDIADLRRDMVQMAAALQELLSVSTGGLAAALKAKGDEAADQAAALRETIQARAGQLRDTAGNEVEQLRGHVRETPLKSVAVAGIAGLLFGLLIGRR